MDFLIKGLLSILEFIIVLGFMAFIHELGHYLMCRLSNIPVEEFGFGFPPRMLKLFTWKGTIFSLNWIPFGAFVKPKGEDDPEKPDGLAAAHPIKRLGMLFGGPVFNLILAVLLFTLLVSQVGVPDTSRIVIGAVVKDSPAAQMGMKPNDTLVEVAGKTIASTDQVRPIIDQYLGKEVKITILRDGQKLTLAGIPRANYPEGQGPLGISLTNPYQPISALEAFPRGLELTGEISKQLFTLPVKMIAGQLTAEQSRIVGPKGIFDIYNQAKEKDRVSQVESPSTPAVNALYFLALISTALGITNLLPLPALDGGRILFVLAELIFRKRVPAKYENLVHAVGFFALIGLLVFVTINDFVTPPVLP